MQVTASLLAQVICNVKITSNQINQAIAFELGSMYRKMPLPLPGLVVTQVVPIYAAAGIMGAHLKGIEIQGNVESEKFDPFGVVLNVGNGEYLFVTMQIDRVPNHLLASELVFYVAGPRQAVDEHFTKITEEIKKVIAYVHKHFKQYIL